MPELSDEIYMRRLQNGEFDAMSILFTKYQAPMFGYFLKQCFDPSVSQELTQQLFIRVFEKRTSFSGKEGMFRPWMYRIAHNLWIDYNKRFATSKFPVMELTDVHDQTDIDERGFDEEDFVRLDQALQRLPPDEKQLIILTKYQQLKYAEVGQILDLSETAVKTRVHRALKMLRNIFFSKPINSVL